MTQICLEDVLTRTVQLDNTSWRRLKDVLKNLQNALKTSWRCHEDVLKTLLKDVLEMFWRRMTKTNIIVLVKTSWRLLENAFWRRMTKGNIFVLIKTPWKWMKTYSEDDKERLFQDVITKISVWWDMSKFKIFNYHKSL